MYISVIICTHNPREDYLRRTLESLETQGLPKDQWELLLIDNASKVPLDGQWDLGWHPHARHVPEPELGLTPARLRGIRESQSELLVFVDDDNVLHADYLASAIDIAARFPQVAVWSGEIVPEFEIEPPSCISRFWSYLALCNVPHSYWANIKDDWCRLPCGAGMCVRRFIANNYHHTTARDPLRRALDRKGTSLASCGDTDLALHACDAGFGYGRFAELRLIHLIPARRLDLAYLLKLEENIVASSHLLRYCRCGESPTTPQGARRWLGRVRRLVTMRPLDRAIFAAKLRGAESAKRQLAGMQQI